MIIGSRQREKAARAVRDARQQLGDQARLEGATNRDAAGLAEVIVLTVPFAGHQALLQEVRDQTRGKVVVDTTVPLRGFRPPQLETIPEGSAAQRAQALLPESRVVSAFHTVSAVTLVALQTPVDQDTLVCGGDEAAKALVMDLAVDIGLRPVDAGPLEVSRTLERLAALVIGLNQRYRRRAIGLRFVGL